MTGSSPDPLMIVLSVNEMSMSMPMPRPGGSMRRVMPVTA
jgi:hypothetical protein